MSSTFINRVNPSGGTALIEGSSIHWKGHRGWPYTIADCGRMLDEWGIQEGRNMRMSSNYQLHGILKPILLGPVFMDQKNLSTGFSIRDPWEMPERVRNIVYCLSNCCDNDCSSRFTASNYDYKCCCWKKWLDKLKDGSNTTCSVFFFPKERAIWTLSVVSCLPMLMPLGLENNIPENKLLLVSINFTPETSHSCLKLWYCISHVFQDVFVGSCSFHGKIHGLTRFSRSVASFAPEKKPLAGKKNQAGPSEPSSFREDHYLVEGLGFGATEYLQHSQGITLFVGHCVCKKSQVAKTDRYGHNALFSAAMNGNLAVVKCLLEAAGAVPKNSAKQSVQQKNGGFMVESVESLWNHYTCRKTSNPEETYSKILTSGLNSLEKLAGKKPTACFADLLLNDFFKWIRRSNLT